MRITGGLLVAALLATAAMPQAALAESKFTFGIEGFTDLNREPIVPDVVEVEWHAEYASVTTSYTYYAANNYFGGIELRGSYGEADYKSPSGFIEDTPQYEGEARLLAGYRFPIRGNRVVPYFSAWTGVGGRFFLDNANNAITDLGAVGYDRRIAQYYIPIGVGLEARYGTWRFLPKLEYDYLAYGRVNSRFQNFGGYNLMNTQRRGNGARGEFMVGQQWGKTSGWEFGPFFRYWQVKQSDLSCDEVNQICGVEPRNTRLQAGAALRVNF